LTDAEEKFARGVFGGTLPYSRIYISDGLGAGGAPWTHRGLWDYVLHMGGAYAAGASSSPYELTFVHELTHVWQGHHSLIPWGFMANSVYHQGLALIRTRGRSRSGAYAYARPPTAPWGSYNVEQQANIVEDWFDSGQPTSGEWFAYVRDNIRAGKN
jgi:hypothetical protein